MEKKLDPKITFLRIRRVANGWAIADGPGFEGRFSEYEGVAETANKLIDIIYNWAKEQEKEND